MEKVLPVSPEIIRQETGWWCGPASCQVALDAAGITKTEKSLMLELERAEGNIRGDGSPFDDQDGTDHIGQVAKVLNGHLPAARYVVVELPQDPPTRAQRDALWTHVVASINAGYAVVVNIVSPPSNRPQIVAPSTVPPDYGSSTIWHYFTLIGYSDVGGRRYRVADSGFSPYQYWATAASIESLIPPKGYTYASATSTSGGTAVDYGITKTIPAGTNGRRSRTDYIAVHTQEGGTGDAVGLANYCAGAGVSYNVACDDVDTVQMVAPVNASWAAVDANGVAFHICGAGTYSAWSADRWLSPDASDGLDENAMLWRMAKAAAAAAAEFNVPIKKVGANTYSVGNWPGERGICGHVAFGANGGGHHDPGLGFPWEEFVRRVASFTAPAPNLIDAEADVAKGWIGKRLTTGENKLYAGGKLIGAFAEFANGHIYWRGGANAAYAVPHGGIFEAWSDRGWERGELGFPVLRHAVVAGGGVQSFERGVLMVQTGGDRKGHVVHGEIGKRYAAMGWEHGPLGWPTSGEEKVAGTDNITQSFEHGRLTWSPTGVVVDIQGA